MQYQQSEKYQKLSEKDKAQIDNDIETLIQLRKRATEFRDKLEEDLDNKCLKDLFNIALMEIWRTEKEEAWYKGVNK